MIGKRGAPSPDVRLSSFRNVWRAAFYVILIESIRREPKRAKRLQIAPYFCLKATTTRRRKRWTRMERKRKKNITTLR
jgi:hypothetical protein